MKSIIIRITVAINARIGIIVVNRFASGIKSIIIRITAVINIRIGLVSGNEFWFNTIIYIAEQNE